jgi:putative endonuclease
VKKLTSQTPNQKPHPHDLLSKPADPKTVWYIYLLKCSDDTLYCGITNNLEKRISTHNAKKGAKYTKTRTPVTLVYYEFRFTKGDALRREYAIKQISRKQKLELIASRRLAVPFEGVSDDSPK